jgi:hypothetical protein
VIVRFLFAWVVLAFGLSGCATQSNMARWQAEQAEWESRLSSQIVLVENVRVDPGAGARLGVVRSEDGPVLAVQLPVLQRHDGQSEQVYFYPPDWQPDQIYVFDLDDDGRREFALRMPSALMNSWLILRGFSLPTQSRAGFWLTYEVPDELFDPDRQDAELVLQVDLTEFR